MNAGGSLTYYRGDFVYSGYMPRLLNPYGMFNPDGLSSWSDYYFMKDHLGSTRMVVSIAGTADPRVVQTTEYYPFGLAHNYNNLDRNKYLYSGKELQDASVNSDRSILGLYDFGARYYDPLLGRWFNIDPALQGLNPYVYCGNNPIMYVDPNGRSFTAALGFFLLGGSILLQAMGNDGDITNLSWTDIGLLGVNIASIAISVAVSSSIGAVGFYPGFISGAIGGMAGGIVGGAGTAAITGTNLWQAIKPGLIMGGIVGGIMGGFNGLAAAGAGQANFWNGNAKPLDITHSGLGVLRHPIDIDPNLDKTNKGAKAFWNKHLGQTKGLRNIYVEGELPPGYKRVNGQVLNADGQPVLGSTRTIGGLRIKARSDVYLYPASYGRQIYYILLWGTKVFTF